MEGKEGARAACEGAMLLGTSGRAAVALVGTLPPRRRFAQSSDVRNPTNVREKIWRLMLIIKLF